MEYKIRHGSSVWTFDNNVLDLTRHCKSKVHISLSLNRLLRVLFMYKNSPILLKDLIMHVYTVLTNLTKLVDEVVI